MNFYEFKKMEYGEPKESLTLKERMAVAKEKVDKQMNDEHEALIESYAHIAHACCTPDILWDTARIHCQMSITEAEEREREARSLSPEQYFSKLAGKESEALSDYLDSKLYTLIDRNKEMQKINSGKGIMVRLDKLLGRLDERASEVHQSIQEVNEQVTVGQEAMAQWDHMSVEEHLDYVVSRFEREGALEFSAEALDQFGIAQLKMKEAQAKETAVVEQTTQPTGPASEQ